VVLQPLKLETLGSSPSKPLPHPPSPRSSDRQKLNSIESRCCSQRFGCLDGSRVVLSPTRRELPDRGLQPAKHFQSFFRVASFSEVQMAARSVRPKGRGADFKSGLTCRAALNEPKELLDVGVCISCPLVPIDVDSGINRMFLRGSCVWSHGFCRRRIQSIIHVPGLSPTLNFVPSAACPWSRQLLLPGAIEDRPSAWVEIQFLGISIFR